MLNVDGKDVATRKMAHTIPFMWPFYESFDVGVAPPTLVNEKDFQVPFRFNGNGKIDKLTFKLGPNQLMARDRSVMHEAYAAAHD